MSDDLDIFRGGVVHGHRGARGIWPENTLAGIQEAFDLGLNVVELDVLLTKDHVPVVTHNAALKAETTRDAEGRWLESRGAKVYELTFAQLRQYNVGGINPGTAYAAAFPTQVTYEHQSIPTLESIAVLMAQSAYRDRWLTIEIKSYVARDDLTPPPRVLAQAIVSCVVENKIADRVVVQSFDWRILEQVAEIAPGLPRSYLTYEACDGETMPPTVFADSPWMGGGGVLAEWHSLPQIITEMGGRMWSPFHKNIDKADVAQAQSYGLIVNPWSVNETADIDRMIAAGVDGIVSDYPQRVQDRLAALGMISR